MEIKNYNFAEKPQRTSRSLLKNPMLLVEKITQDRETEREKFYAIYNWVFKNITYNYRTYYASGIFPQPNLLKIFQSKKATAFEMTYVMDTLCLLAGIKNVSLSGYARNLLSDVNDSLYNDTHVWSAVKLDNAWQLYDITFSHGYFYYRYTKFSQFIVNLKKRFTIKYIPKIVKEKKMKYYRTSLCNSYVVDESEEKRIVVLVPVYRHKLLRRILSLFQIKIILDYKKEQTSKFFLTEPTLFSTTHFPNDPNWSLLNKRSRKYYETDSAYYHLDDSMYLEQSRRGVVCIDCDTYLSLNPLNKEFYYRKNSTGFNNRNTFAPAKSEYKIACLKFEESKPVEDSLTKITLLDSALAFIQHAKTNYLKASSNLSTNHYLQSNKNSKKVSDLVDDNKLHSSFIRSKMLLSFQETKNLRDLENKMNTDAKKYYFRNRTINHYKKGAEIDRNVQRVELTINQLTTQLILKNKLIDSINNLIKTNRVQFDATLPDLYENIILKVKSHDSLLSPLKKSIALRQQFHDSYKKKVVEARKEMYSFERNYSNEIDSIIYKPAAFCYETGKVISSLIDQRNRARQESYRLKAQLVKFSVIPPEELDKYREELKYENQEDLCWIKGNNQYLQAVFYGFKTLLDKQKQFEGMLVYENKLEVSRYLLTTFALNKQKRECQKIIAGSRKFLNSKNSEIKKNKSEYLKKLRRKRREERIGR